MWNTSFSYVCVHIDRKLQYVPGKYARVSTGISRLNFRCTS